MFGEKLLKLKTTEQVMGSSAITTQSSNKLTQTGIARHSKVDTKHDITHFVS